MDKNTSKSNFYKMDKPPHLHIGFEKTELMLKTFLLMGIIAVASVIVMGLDALIHIMIALGTVLIVHGMIESYQIWKGKKKTYESPASPMVMGLIVGLSIAIASPFWVTAAVALLAILVFKYGQGRYFERKYLNPAAASKVLLLLLLTLKSLDFGLLFHTHHLSLNITTAEGLQSSMWIFSRETLPLLGDLSPAQSLFMWQTHGWVGGGSSLVVLIVGAAATYWLRYKWRIVLSTLGTMTILAAGFGLYLGGDPILRIAFHVFTGSVIFLAFFMATEPQSTPMPEKSQYAFGVGLAVLTFILQLMNVLGGSVIALVLMNMTTPYLDKIGIKKPYGHRTKEGGD